MQTHSNLLSDKQMQDFIVRGYVTVKRNFQEVSTKPSTEKHKNAQKKKEIQGIISYQKYQNFKPFLMIRRYAVHLPAS